MAAIPFILHIGNTEANGPLPVVPTTFLSGTEQPFAGGRLKYKWTVPCDTATGYIPGSILYQPYWDQTLSAGLGNWTVYAPIAGQIYTDVTLAANKGNNHNNGGVGLSAAVAYMQKFREYYGSTSPYFKCMKMALPGGLAEWRVGQSSYNDFTTRLTRGKSLISPDTLDLKLVIIDLNGDDGAFASPGGDIKNFLGIFANYKTYMKALIDDIRTNLFSASNAIVILVSHCNNYLYTSGSSGLAAGFFKVVNREIMTEMTNVFTYEMKDEDLGSTTPHIIYNAVNGADAAFYHQEAYFKQGEDFFQIFKRRTESATRPSQNGVIPTFLSIGDSKSVGEMTGTVQGLLALASVGVSTRTNQFIYNKLTDAIEVINPGPTANFNTGGQVTTNCGPILSWTDKLSGLYPDGFLAIHMGKGGAHVAAQGMPAYSSGASGDWSKGKNENYEQYKVMVDAAKQLAFNQSGSVELKKTAVVYGIFAHLGDNNTSNIANAQRFKPAMKTLINSLRSDYGVSIYGIETPVVLVMPHKNTQLGDASARILVRESIIEICEEMKNVGYVNIDKYDLNIDNIHDAAESVIPIGIDMFNKYVELLENIVPTL